MGSAAVSNDAGVAKLKALFAELDKNGDGGVSGKEWGSSVSKKRDALAAAFGGDSLKTIGKLFSVADGDGDGSLSFDEFLALAQARGKLVIEKTQAVQAPTEGDIQLSAAVSSAEGLAKLRALFGELDLDKSGEVSGKEWGRNVYKKREALSKYFGGSSLKSIGTLFSVADADGNDSITFDEFVALAKTRGTAIAASTGSSIGDIQLSAAVSSAEGVAKIKALFDGLDKNGDGGVSGKEWGSSVYKKRDELAAVFGGSTLKAIGKLFTVADGDGDGSLSFEEFLALAHARAKSLTATTAVAPPTPPPAVVTSSLFNEDDIQFCAAIGTDEGVTKLKALFNELDKDNSGEVSSKEWGRSVYQKREALSKFFGGSSLKAIGTLFSVADAD